MKVNSKTIYFMEKEPFYGMMVQIILELLQKD